MPSSTQKKGLGRGLDALLPGGGNAPDLDGLLRSEPQRELSITQIQPNPNQPRTYFDSDALAELAASIKSTGIVQPILVRPLGNGTFEIVAGERRFRAACSIGMLRVPVVVKTYSDEDALTVALIENLLREDLKPLEAAVAYQKLMDTYTWTQDTLGTKIGKSRSAIANSLRLLALPAPVQQALDSGEISEGHARALLGSKEQRLDESFPKRQQELLREAKAGRLTVRQLESEMASTETRGEIRRADRIAKRGSTEVQAVEQLLRNALGMRARLTGNLEKGTVVISYSSQEELTQIVDKITGGEGQ
ncbi:MAG: ParB/RepB/Spo0J family partition protein [Armatimonadota bacterium]